MTQSILRNFIPSHFHYDLVRQWPSLPDELTPSVINQFFQFVHKHRQAIERDSCVCNIPINKKYHFRYYPSLKEGKSGVCLIVVKLLAFQGGNNGVSVAVKINKMIGKSSPIRPKLFAIISTLHHKTGEYLEKEILGIKAAIDLKVFKHVAYFQKNVDHVEVLQKYYACGSLFEFLLQQRTLSSKQQLSIALQLAAHLLALHEKGYAHQDIKIKNILVKRASAPLGENFQADFIDCGSVEKSQSLGPDCFMGTIQNCSPETIALQQGVLSSIDPFKRDIWALGLVFSFLLTGMDFLNSIRLSVQDAQEKLMGYYRVPARGTDELYQFLMHSIPHSEWRYLLQGMLAIQPQQRFSIELVQMYLEKLAAEEEGRSWSVIPC